MHRLAQYVVGGTAALLIAVTSVSPALADDWEVCAETSGSDAIEACTRVIDSGSRTGRALAVAYSNRGVEWKAQGQLAKAIADYDAAIKADSRHVAAYNNRGIAYAAQGEVRQGDRRL